jgi:hypothetical protein
MKSVLFALFSVAILASGGFAQTTSAPKPPVSGAISAVSEASNLVTVKTTTGETIDLTVTPHSFILHLPLGETDPKKAAKLAIGDLSAGEELVASYQLSSDGKVKEARTIYVRTKGDLEEMAKKDDEDWRKRGTTGNLSALSPAAKTFTIKSGSKDVAVKVAEKTEFLRYSADSAKSNDAKPSSFAELKAGDEVHVLGNKNPDGTEIGAEKVVFGFFPQIAATIKSVNAAGNEMVVTDLATKKPVTIRFVSDSIMRKLPDMAAQALARRYGAARGGGEGAGGRGAGRGGGGFGGPGGPGGPGGQGGGRGGDIAQILDHAPAITLNDLKAGDAIMVKTTAGSGSGPGTAVMLIAGVEPILTAAPNSTRDIMSGWNLGGGGGGEGN